MPSVFRILLLSLIILSQGIYHASAKETIILLFGDSIISGYGVAVEESVPARLQAILKEKNKEIIVINGGVSGDTTSAGRNRLAWTLDKNKPDLVILALGGNDVLRGISPNITKTNILAMLEELKKRNITTILSAVSAPYNLGPSYRKELEAIYTDAAASYNIKLYPFLLTDTFGKNELMQQDGIHPNTKGADLIARKLAAYIAENNTIH